MPASGFDEKVRTKQGYVYVKDEEIIGVLRYNLFWDNTPFCTMLYIADKYRGQGYGKQLMEHWELEMRAKGYGMVMTSTQWTKKRNTSTVNSDTKMPADLL